MLMILYHWTHSENMNSIQAIGIDPSFAEGRKKCVWVCAGTRIGWAMCHIAQRHGWNPDEMVCYRVELPAEVLKRTAIPEVYTCDATIIPEDIVAVMYRIDNGFFSRRGEFPRYLPPTA